MPLKKYNKIALHILVWTLLFLLPFIFAVQAENSGSTSKFGSNTLKLITVMNGCWALAFFLNTFIFIPRLLYQRKVVLFILINLSLFTGILFLNRWFYHFLIFEQPYVFSKAIIFNGVLFLFFVLNGVAFKIVSDRIKMERIAKERESENLKTELSFLRSQISPHFLFNVLNNIVALVRLKSDILEPTIIKLSSLMQYMLYETDEDKVLLKSEVDYLQSYTELQKLRFGDRLTLHIDLQVVEDWHAIEPMLLIPFIENAFKHGTGMINNPIIHISLTAVNNELNFMVKNKYVDEDKAKDKVSGIGLTNVKRRLELLYGKNQSLKIDTTDDWYTVNLQIGLKP